MDCSICCEKFNKSNHFQVICKGCDGDESACRTCCQKYILNGNQEPVCMFCKSAWDRDFMNTALSKKFVTNDLKLFSENLMVDKQVALLPDTQNEAFRRKKQNDLNAKRSEAFSELNRIKKLLDDQKDLIKAYTLQIYRLSNGIETDVKEKENFTVKCNTPDCKGFLDSKYYCSLCETKYCRHCMEIKTPEHECNEDTIATFRAIRKEAKPCPGCGEMISKIDGCDQMWCIKCHTQFSWRNGNIITGYNHNPEFFRWMRESGQTIPRRDEGPLNREICGRNVNGYEITRIVTNVFPNSRNTVAYFQNLYAFHRHVEIVHAAVDFPANINNDVILRNLRVGYLLGEISKDAWKKTLQQIDKKTKKTEAYNNIWRLVHTVMSSFIERILDLHTNNNNKTSYCKIIKESNDFKTYINDCFIKASCVFGSSSCPGINDNWREVPNYKKFLKSKKD